MPSYDVRIIEHHTYRVVVNSSDFGTAEKEALKTYEADSQDCAKWSEVERIELLRLEDAD